MGMKVNQKIPVESMTDIRKVITASYVQHSGWIAQLTETTNIFFLEDLYQRLTATVNQLDTIVANTTSVPDLRAYAQAQFGDSSDIVADYQAWKAQAAVCSDWIVANASGTVTPGQPIPEVDATQLAVELTTLRTLSE